MLHRSAVLEALAEWDIDNDQVVSVVTDNASNIIPAMQKAFENRRLPCFMYTLNLITKTATSLEHINATIVKFRYIVKYFNNSVNKSD